MLRSTPRECQVACSDSGSAEEMLEFAMRFEEAGGAELVFPIDSFSVSFGASNATPADPVGDGPSGCRLSVSRVADGRSLRLLKNLLRSGASSSACFNRYVGLRAWLPSRLPPRPARGANSPV